MRNKKFLFLSILSLFFGAMLIVNAQIIFTGAFIGLENTFLRFKFFLGVVFVLVSIVLFIGGLEKKFEDRAKSAHQYVKLKKDLERREKWGEDFISEIIRSDLNRVRKIPTSEWTKYDKNLSYEENTKRLMTLFHSDNMEPGLEINDEIREAYRKIKDINVEDFYGKGEPNKEKAKKIWENTKKQYLNSEDFHRFEKKSIEEIQRLDKEALSKKIVPILRTKAAKSRDYPGFNSQMIYFGPSELYGKYKTPPTKKEEEKDPHIGKNVFKYHLIYDPNDIKRGKIPHGHWELDYIGKMSNK